MTSSHPAQHVVVRTKAEISSVTKVFGSDDHSKVALEDVNLTIADQEFVCLLGPSGCGKTTLLNCMAGFIAPTAGRVAVSGRTVTAPGSERGVVFQEHGLFPWYTVAQNIGLGPRLRGVRADERNEIIGRYIDMMGLGGFADHFPSQLSGGMKQRVGIARALANQPEVLLMDEPFGALDAQTRQALQEELLQIWETERKTVVFVTHSIPEAIYLADRVVIMASNPGRIREIVEIPIPRVRDRASPEIMELYRVIDDLLKTNKAAGG